VLRQPMNLESDQTSDRYTPKKLKPQGLNRWGTIATTIQWQGIGFGRVTLIIDWVIPIVPSRVKIQNVLIPRMFPRKCGSGNETCNNEGKAH